MANLYSNPSILNHHKNGPLQSSKICLFFVQIEYPGTKKWEWSSHHEGRKKDYWKMRKKSLREQFIKKK
jgi:hypothetical protein